jgi:hypothetical protein
MTVLGTGEVFVAGGAGAGCGAGSHTPLDSTERYDPSTGSSAAAASLAGPKTNHSAVKLSNGKVLLSGGLYCYFSGLVGWTSGETDAAEIYDPVADTSTPTGSLNNARRNHFSFALPGGKALIVGGRSAVNNVPFVELYDSGTGLFTNQGQSHLTFIYEAALLTNGKVLLVGEGGAGKAAEIYDPDTGTATSTGAPHQLFYYSAIASLPDGTALIAGAGYDDNTAAEIYTP